MWSETEKIKWICSNGDICHRGRSASLKLKNKYGEIEDIAEKKLKPMITRIHKLNQSRAVDGTDIIQLCLSEQWAGAMMIAEVLAVRNTEMLNIRRNSFLKKCHGNGSKPMWLLKILSRYLKVRIKYPEVTVHESSILWPSNFSRYLEKTEKK